MTGKLLSIVLVLAAVIAGGSLYYLQIYGYYDAVPSRPGQDVVLVSKATQASVPIDYTEFQAIDADSSPIRYRACFSTSLTLDQLSETYVTADTVSPRNAPKWFDCFQAEKIGREIESETARVFLGVKNVHFGVDRLVAITADGRGFAWHDLNECGEKAYDGTVVGEECPQRPPSDQ